MTPDAERLRQLIHFNEPAAPVAFPLLLILYWAYPATVLLILVGSMVPTFIFQRIAVRYAVRNQVAEGITALSIAIWCPTLAMAIFTPQLWPLTAVFCILSVVLALPFVTSGHLLKLLIAASGILMIGAASSAISPPLSMSPVPNELREGLEAVATLVGAILCMFSIWQSNGRLRDTLEETRSANEALRESERTLERKVDERTAQLAQSHRSLADARDTALQASRAKSDFLANMSHELRTPLNAIIGYGEMLQEEARDNNHEEYLADLDRVVSSGRYLLSLINSILDLSKIEAGKMEVHLETFDLDQFVGEVKDTITPLVRKNNNAIEVHVADSLGLMESDVTKVRQVLFNLLSNASKFTRDGTIELDVKREARPPDGDWILFRVRDTGIGMTPAQLSRAFEAFSQAEETTARDYGGTGLGLAITRQFCEILGGSIHGESELGSGSTFDVRLPARPSTSERRESRAKAVVARPGASTVLVVDDDASSRDLLSRFLNREGFAVITASGGAEALRLAREHLPTAITLDVIMPGMDGWEVLRQLKEDPELETIPVVLLTVSDEQDLGYSLGAAEYLTKPVDGPKLSTIVARFQRGGAADALVVDDDPAARDMASRSLERDGWNVRQAANGLEALAEVGKKMPSLIILDLIMPEMDGFDFVAALHENPDWKAIPIIVVTAMDVSDSDRRRLGATVTRIFQKGSYRMADLGDAIHRIVMDRNERTI